MKETNPIHELVAGIPRHVEKVKDIVDVKKAHWFILFYSLAVLVLRLQEGVIWGSDTTQYIEKSIIRPPGYPFLMDIFKYLFGTYEYLALVSFQLIFVLLSGFYLSHILRRKFDLHPITFILITLLLSVPLLSSSVILGIHGRIANRLLTEAVSYGLFLTAMSFLVKILFTRQKLDFIIFLMLIAALTLIRTQMIFLYVIAFVLIPLYCQEHANKSHLLGLIVILLAIFLCTDFSERLYHRFVNNYFGKVSLNASHMLVGAVYVSDKGALGLIENAKDRDVLKLTYDSLESRSLLAKQRFGIDRRLVDLYNDNFAVILGYSLMSSFQHIYAFPKWGDEMLVQFEAFSRRVVPVLTIHYYKDVAKLMLLKFLYTLNFREGFFFATFLLFPFVKFTRELKAFALFMLLMLLINRLMMTPIIYIGDRYLFYTDILEYVILVIMAEKYLRSRA